jgi:hypothetical protein
MGCGTWHGTPVCWCLGVYSRVFAYSPLGKRALGIQIVWIAESVAERMKAAIKDLSGPIVYGRGSVLPFGRIR